MRKIPTFLATLLLASSVGCGSSTRTTDNDLSTLGGRYESSERMLTHCMDGNEYELPMKSVWFDPSGNPCIQNGCSDSIGCLAVENRDEVLDAIGQDCVVEDAGATIRCLGVTFLRQ